MSKTFTNGWSLISQLTLALNALARRRKNSTFSTINFLIEAKKLRKWSAIKAKNF
jgi:hypothetical protein